MLQTVKGYYDGDHIIVSDVDRQMLRAGDELAITILSKLNSAPEESIAERRMRVIKSKSYVERGMTAEEIDKHIKELRNEDRF